MKYMCVNMGSKGTRGLGKWKVNEKMPQGHLGGSVG